MCVWFLCSGSSEVTCHKLGHASNDSCELVCVVCTGAGKANTTPAVCSLHCPGKAQGSCTWSGHKLPSTKRGANLASELGSWYLCCRSTEFLWTYDGEHMNRISVSFWDRLEPSFARHGAVSWRRFLTQQIYAIENVLQTINNHLSCNLVFRMKLLCTPLSRICLMYQTTCLWIVFSSNQDLCKPHESPHFS